MHDKSLAEEGGSPGPLGTTGEDDVVKLPDEVEEAIDESDVLELELDVLPMLGGDFLPLSSRVMSSIRLAKTSLAGLRASGSHLPMSRACHHPLSEAECRKTSVKHSSTTRAWSSLSSKAQCSVAASRSAAASLASCCFPCVESRRPQESILNTIKSTKET